MSKKELQLAHAMFETARPELLPLSFDYDGEPIRGIPSSFQTTVTRTLVSASISQTIYTGRSSDGIEIRVEYVEYKDFPVTEWVAFVTNTSDCSSKLIANLRIVDYEIRGTDPKLVYSNGDTLKPDGYALFERDVNAEPFYLSPTDGTSCKGASPYMKLAFESYSVRIGIGWPGKWSSIVQATPHGATVSIGQDRFRTFLQPGETMRTPRVNLMCYTGDEDRGRNMWRRWYLTHILPREHGKPLPPKLCLHYFKEGGKPEFTGATAKNQVYALNRYVERGMKPDIWWIDAGWYPCDGKWPAVGTWEVDRERFPDGLTPIGERCEELDVSFLLWFEPERVTPGTWLDKEHPDWLLYSDAGNNTNRLLNYANPDALDWTIQQIDHLIKESRAHIYRQDFNFDPLPYWVKYEGEDRIGAIENLHIQGYLKLWDELLDRNPGLWIDSCASGGRRNDLETMRRSVPLHYTDVGYGHHPIKQKQHRFMFEWIPYFRAHTMSWDNDEGTYEPRGNKREDSYAYHAAMTPSITSMITYDDSDALFELGVRMHTMWRKAAELMLTADYYPLTETRTSEEDYYAMQFHKPDTDRGFFQVVRNTRSPEEAFTVNLKRIHANKAYVLENMETGEKRTVSGAELNQGFVTAIPKRSGQLWFYWAEVTTIQ